MGCVSSEESYVFAWNESMEFEPLLLKAPLTARVRARWMHAAVYKRVSGATAVEVGCKNGSSRRELEQFRENQGKGAVDPQKDWLSELRTTQKLGQPVQYIL